VTSQKNYTSSTEVVSENKVVREIFFYLRDRKEERIGEIYIIIS
jgi:hypothetical protein